MSERVAIKMDMTNREVALEFLRCFCAPDIDGLAPLLARDLKFTGTLYSYDSAADYLDGLRRDPPQSCGYRVLSITEGPDSVAVFYEYQKPGRAVTIAQFFRLRDAKIVEMRVVFDTAP